MKTNLIRAILAVLISTITAKAVVVAHLEDSVTRTWFSVSWGAVPFAPLIFLENGPVSDAGAIDNNTSVHIDAIHPFFMDSFDVNFAVGSRLFSTAAVSGFSGVQLLPLTGDPYGVQVVYGEPVPVNGVPDAGGTAGLLAVACGVLFWGARRST